MLSECAGPTRSRMAPMSREYVGVKPGIGIGSDSNSGDRDWTVELGFRFFFPTGRDAYDMMTQGR